MVENASNYGNFAHTEYSYGVPTVQESGQFYELEATIDEDIFYVRLDNHADQTPDRMTITWTKDDHAVIFRDEGLDGGINRISLDPLESIIIYDWNRDDLAKEGATIFVQTLYEQCIDQLLGHYGIGME